MPPVPRALAPLRAVLCSFGSLVYWDVAMYSRAPEPPSLGSWGCAEGHTVSLMQFNHEVHPPRHVASYHVCCASSPYTRSSDAEVLHARVLQLSPAPTIVSQASPAVDPWPAPGGACGLPFRCVTAAGC